MIFSMTEMAKWFILAIAIAFLIAINDKTDWG
nr:MAG TPA: hypothetical protein [Caudoviricetes sp.]DAT93705.1 MAG TPA: hypothetical protein [Caudoviricetes sp.]